MKGTWPLIVMAAGGLLLGVIGSARADHQRCGDDRGYWYDRGDQHAQLHDELDYRHAQYHQGLEYRHDRLHDRLDAEHERWHERQPYASEDPTSVNTSAWTGSTTAGTTGTTTEV
jgi:hypothetical protein